MTGHGETHRVIADLVARYDLPVLRSTFSMTDEDVGRYSTHQDHRFALVVVFNSAGEFLLLRNNIREWGWEIPGGSVEPEEDFFGAARREALEEAGVFIEDLAPLCVIEAEIQSPNHRFPSRGVAFWTVWSGSLGECESNTTVRAFLSSIPKESKHLNAEVLRLAVTAFESLLPGQPRNSAARQRDE